jgi:hypothetical protein
MIESVRRSFNDKYTEEKYQGFLKDIEETYNYTPKFRISESPVFIDKVLKNKLIEACNDILKVIENPNFKTTT